MNRSYTVRFWMFSSRLPALVSLVSLAACGELNDIDYPGEERFRVTGTIESLANDTEGLASYVTLSWKSLQIVIDEGDAPVAGDAAPVEFPAQFRLQVFDVPDDKQWAFREGDGESAVGVIAVGNIFVFEDSDRDRRFDVEDVVRGGTRAVVVYVGNPSDAYLQRLADQEGGPFANAEALVRGFQLGALDEEGRIALPVSSSSPDDVVIRTVEDPPL